MPPLRSPAWGELAWSWRNLQVYVATHELSDVDLGSLTECLAELRERVAAMRDGVSTSQPSPYSDGGPKEVACGRIR